MTSESEAHSELKPSKNGFHEKSTYSQALLYLASRELILLVGVVYVSHLSSPNFAMKEITARSDCLILKRVERITAPFDDLESWKIPDVVPLNDEQRAYVSQVMLALIAVVGEGYF